MKELLNGKLMEETLGKLMGLHPELEEGLAQIHMALHDPYGYVCQLEAAWRLEETEDGCPDITDGHILKFAEMLYSQEFISGETSYELSSQFQDHLIHEDRKGRILYRVQELLGDQFSVSIHGQDKILGDSDYVLTICGTDGESYWSDNVSQLFLDTDRPIHVLAAEAIKTVMGNDWIPPKNHETDRRKAIEAEKGYEVLDRLFTRIQKAGYHATQKMLDKAWQEWMELPEAGGTREGSCPGCGGTCSVVGYEVRFADI